MSTEKSTKLAVFNGKRIRKTLHEGEWWFSIIDVVEVLVGGDRPRKYWNTHHPPPNPIKNQIYHGNQF